MTFTPRARALVAVVAAATLLAGCSPEPVGVDVVPDWSYVDTRNREILETQMELLTQSIDAKNPFNTTEQTNAKGLGYVHATYGDKDTGSQSEIFVMGNPASIHIRQTDESAGSTIDTLHVAGQEVDYLLFGTLYSVLAPTPWVQVPTRYGLPGESALAAGLRSMCFIDGFQQMCEIFDTIVLTQQSELGDEARVSIERRDGTVRVMTEVTLKSVLDNWGFLNMPKNLSAEMPQEMLDEFIPVVLWQDEDGALIKIELNGSVPGRDGAKDFSVQAGFEITGTATVDDFPAPPVPWDFTVIDPGGLKKFYDEMGRI